LTLYLIKIRVTLAGWAYDYWYKYYANSSLCRTRAFPRKRQPLVSCQRFWMMVLMQAV